MIKKFYFSPNDFLFLIIPITIILGPAFSLINIIIFCCFYLFKHFNKDHLKFFLKNKIIFLLFLFYTYLILNTLISVDPSSGIYRNLGFIRFIILFIAINYFFFLKRYNYSLLQPWLFIFLIFVFDVYFERFFGTNLLGFGGETTYGPRVVSFFKDEPVAGAYLNGFLFLMFGYLYLILRNKSNLLKHISLVILTLLVISVFITGERSNTLKALLGFFIFLFFFHQVNFKFKFLFVILFVSFISLIFSQSDYLKSRYFGQIYNKMIIEEKRKDFFKNNIYLSLYRSGFTIFENNPYLGVGNKNYRVVTCDKNYGNNTEYVCNTHPHQIYFELLSEHGIVGTICILSILFYLTFKNLRKIIDSKNYIQIGAFIYIITNFIPIIPSGSFFNDFNLTFFMLNFSLMYAVSSKTNIFENKPGPLAQ